VTVKTLKDKLKDAEDKMEMTAQVVVQCYLSIIGIHPFYYITLSLKDSWERGGEGEIAEWDKVTLLQFSRLNPVVVNNLLFSDSLPNLLSGCIGVVDLPVVTTSSVS